MSCIFKNALPLAQTSTTYFYRTPFHFALPPKIQNDLQKSGVRWIFEPIVSGVRGNGIYGGSKLNSLKYWGICSSKSFEVQVQSNLLRDLSFKSGIREIKS
jgi:hypothetical protein